MQKKELKSNIDKRCEEIENYFRDKEKAFEIEKRSELHYIDPLREKAEKKLEQVALDIKKLNDEKKEKPIENASQLLDDQSPLVMSANND